MVLNKVKKLLASISALLAVNSVSAATVQTCTLDYQGVINAVDIDDGIVTGFVKLFAKESRGESFTLVAESGEEFERAGTITTAVDLTDFTNDGLTAHLIVVLHRFIRLTQTALGGNSKCGLIAFTTVIFSPLINTTG